jgi:hypothetical protein
MNISTMKQPAAFIPVVMSFAALLTIQVLAVLAAVAPVYLLGYSRVLRI